MTSGPGGEQWPVLKSVTNDAFEGEDTMEENSRLNALLLGLMLPVADSPTPT